MDLGSRIVAWRKHKGWTQQKLAKKLGLTPAAVCQWEAAKPGKGKTEPVAPRPKHLAAMADAFGVTMQQFFGPVPKPKRAA